MQPVVSSMAPMTMPGMAPMTIPQAVPQMPMQMSAPAQSPADWSIPPGTQQKYGAIFHQTDKARTGFLAGVQARNILLQSGLPQNVLAQIW